MVKVDLGKGKKLAIGQTNSVEENEFGLLELNYNDKLQHFGYLTNVNLPLQENDLQVNIGVNYQSMLQELTDEFRSESTTNYVSETQNVIELQDQRHKINKDTTFSVLAGKFSFDKEHKGKGKIVKH